ncbi:uncharacterized protein LAESUDRAFT_731151 [Laetiporus sulphureus 93-53]|uniref:Potassium transport protein n=1 Tax=Laetiporus sulphureus 93-53 TaxID=1314785 RepID=A0A165BQ28_9APHY|nr:uncharacterized protein LAESUDRAFT_731151 [Laetiporus sulphureus 93-53]KZT01449.1 hypothetical protein LAESUDRAFT_731151 [Laetiporus sulphureus 93-53]
MPSLPSRRLSRNWLHRLQDAGSYILSNLNFYRIHILVFTFTPLIFSGIFYAVNGKYHIPYIDCLFTCVSAMMVCGLASIDLSKLTPLQQFLLFAQMCLGSPIFVSWVIVYVRRSFFAKRFQHIMEADMARKLAHKYHEPVHVKLVPWWRRALESLLPRNTRSINSRESVESSSRDARGGLRTDMVRRTDDAPRLVNPSGWISEGRPEVATGHGFDQDGTHEPDVPSPLRYLAFSDIDNPALVNAAAPGGPLVKEPADQSDTVSGTTSSTRTDSESDFADTGDHQGTYEEGKQQKEPARMLSESAPMTDSPISEPEEPSPRSTFTASAAQNRQGTFPRQQTIEFAASSRPLRHARSAERPLARHLQSTLSQRSDQAEFDYRRPMRRPTLSYPESYDAYSFSRREDGNTSHGEFGGFPMPLEIGSRLFGRLFPNLKRKLTRTMTMPRTRTIVSQHGSMAPGARPVSYISFEAVVGRNSTFKSLTKEQLEELGGVEYRALGALLWIVGGYHIMTQLLAFVVIAPYMSIPRWASDFKPPQLYRDVSPVWFAAFQVVTSYTNSGMSLEDESMIPFQRAYPMIFFMIFLILAGYTAFPIFLRVTIWTLSKIVPQGSRIRETLHFLLDHPRRCYIYLFPSYQTWFLVLVLIALNGTDWFCFEVLDLGNPTVMTIPPGDRVLVGLLQAVAVRSAGFSTVNLANLAPAVKTLYVMMMYISVYPLAMSVRSTNVYEEKSLGIYEDDNDATASLFDPRENRVTVWSRYLATHMRKQLSFDMWWLGTALVLVCIIERDGLEDESNSSWFNIFRILFEIVSAYGGVGLSLGVPYDNYSFSGALRPLSKLIICLVMLRGRHRGLPVAIDRAVMLPAEFYEPAKDGDQEGLPEDHRPDIPNGHVPDGRSEKSRRRASRQRSQSMSRSVASDSTHQIPLRELRPSTEETHEEELSQS